MKFTDRVRALLRLDGGTTFSDEFAATGRPRNIEGESMVLGNDLLASMTRVRDGGIYFMPTDDIIKQKGWPIYKEMIQDDQVKSCLEFKKILVSGRAWEIAPGDATPEALRQADFLQDNLDRICINEVFKEALSALEFGFSLGEKVYHRDTWEEDGQQYVFLKKIAHREPSQIHIEADEHGNVKGARQFNTQSGAGNTIDLPAEKIWLFTHDKRFGNNYGNSDLRSAYRSWWAKKFIIQFWNVYLERMGSPMTTMKYPQGASADLKNTLKQIMRNLSSKTEILIPEGVEIELIEAQRGGAPTYETALTFHNQSIARSLLMVGLYGQQGQSATTTQGNSQGFIQLRMLFKMADAISQALQKSFMEQVAYPLLDINFEKPIYPKFIWQDYGQFEGQVVADEIRQLHAAGVLDLDQKDVNYLRSIMGLPLRGPDDEEDEVIRPEPLPPPGGGAAQPPAAPQGNDRAGEAEGVKKTEASYRIVLREADENSNNE